MAERFMGLLLSVVLCLSPAAAISETQSTMYSVGVSKIDITPDYPIRLTGYASRQKESEGVAQRLYARALAFGSDSEKAAILVTVENCGIPASIRDQVAARLRKKKHVDPERFALCSTHTHTGPWVEGFAPNIFGGPIPKEQAQRVKGYTRELTEALISVSLRALENRSPARLTRGRGTAEFAANRRTKGGPVDHDLPALFVTGSDGTLRAIFLSYACHCTTLGGDFNQICGDWAGYAAEDLEREHAGSVALVALGCAGDANPSPRSTLDLAKQHGQEIAVAVNALLRGPLSAVEGGLACRTQRIELPLEELPTRTDWQRLAQQTNFVGSHARLNLARLERGEHLPTTVPYMIQTWTFGDDLGLVFLPGEVVVDYSLRLKREFDPKRLWINAYANDVPCYIPSERILAEGGYEGGGAMIYYDKPCRLATGIENAIVQTVRELLPVTLANPTAKIETAN